MSSKLLFLEVQYRSSLIDPVLLQEETWTKHYLYGIAYTKYLTWAPVKDNDLYATPRLDNWSENGQIWHKSSNKQIWLFQYTNNKNYFNWKFNKKSIQKILNWKLPLEFLLHGYPMLPCNIYKHNIFYFIPLTLNMNINDH